jgi:hypothetical protein
MKEVYYPAIPYFLDCLNDATEAPIVRHEILMSMSLLIYDPTVIWPYQDDPDPII